MLYTTEPTGSSIPTRPWTTGSLPPPVRGCNTSSSSWGQKFSGVDPIRVISFLAQCKENFENANMTEAMALMALPHLLSPLAEEAYESQKGLHCKSQGIASWAAAVNLLLPTYATNLEIEQAFSTLRDTRQKPGELETEYATRISTALGRCGDVHSP